MSVALGLLRLQQVDIRIGRNEARLHEIQQSLDNDAELTTARDTLKAAELQLRESDHARRTAEAERSAQRAKIGQTESSLYGGSVRNPKELQDLQADLVSLQKRLATTEEQELEAMMSVEAAETQVRAAEARVGAIQARLEQEHHKLIEERAGLTRDLESLQAERQAALGTVAREFLAQYESLRQQRRGVAVAEVSDNACAACGTTLTAALQQNARHANQLTFCPSCGRILYAG